MGAKYESGMKTKLHVGNLSSRATEKNLRFLFAQKGRVRDVELTIERTVGRSRAFAIVTMATVEGAQAALLALHRSIWNGRHITVNEVPAAPVEHGEFSFGAQQTITPFFPIRTKAADKPALSPASPDKELSK
jgi:RNA recognition motif-containing protein